MQRLRSTWLALTGGALLVALSVSVAFGADPVDAEGNRGQTIAAFVHELVFGANDEADEGADENEDTDGDTEEDAPEDASEVIEFGGEITDPETTEDSEDSAREVPEEFANHGECVSEAAHDAEGFAESDAANKGEWVSQHARYVCWGLEVPDQEADADTADVDEPSAKEQRKADAAAARAERKAERAAARAARTHAGAQGHGQGHGHGGGRP